MRRGEGDEHTPAPEQSAMTLPALRRAIDARFGCDYRLSTYRSESGVVLRVRYGTAQLTRTWDEFVDGDDEPG